MTRHIFVVAGLILSFCPLGLCMAQDEELRAELLDRFTDAMPPDLVTDVETFEANGFSVTSADVKQLDAKLQPDGTEFQLLTVDAKGVFNVSIVKGRQSATSGSIEVTHYRSRQPMLTAADRDADGQIDLVEYYVLDENGEWAVRIVDYEADGQADLRMNFSENYNEIWHRDRWYRVENRDGTRGILVEGEFREIEVVDNRQTVR